MKTKHAIDRVWTARADQLLLADHYADAGTWGHVNYHLKRAAVYERMCERLLTRLVRETLHTCLDDTTSYSRVVDALASTPSIGGGSVVSSGTSTAPAMRHAPTAARDISF